MDIINKIDELRQIADGYADALLLKELSELKQKFLEQKLYVVVVGLFKRGKSTLINSLLNANILPSSVTPVTALITIVEYGDTPSAKVLFDNNVSKNINAGEIDEYVTEEKNPENEKHVQYVHLFQPSPILHQISLVDSPGLGSAYEHNTAATLSFIPRIDAALFLLSADIPVSKIDIELLTELRQHVAKIIFVFNKADLLSETDLDKLVKHNKTILSKELKMPKEDIPFYIVSSLQRDSECFLSLTERLRSLGQHEKEELLQVSSLHQIQLLTQKTLLQIQFISDAYRLPIHELEERQKQISTSIGLMQEQKGEFESIITGKIKILQQTINENVNATRLKIDEKVKGTIESITDIEESSLHHLQQEINNLVLTSFERVKDEWESRAKEIFMNLLRQYSQRSQSFLNELNTNLSEYLGENMELLSKQFDLSAYSSFYLTLDSGMQTPTASSSLLSHLLPVMVKRKKIQSNWMHHYSEVITRNTASILYDLNYKIQESFRKFNYDLTNKTSDILFNMKEKIQDVINSKSKAEMQNEDKINDLNYRISKLKNSKN